jgi:hypothetical protein
MLKATFTAASAVALCASPAGCATPTAVPTASQQPYVQHSDDGAFGPGLQAFGPAQPPTRLALTAAIFANQNPDKPQFILVFTMIAAAGMSR